MRRVRRRRARLTAMAAAQCDVAVVGSGFAGSILSRALARLGRRVVLIERGRHPRFALGESTTPLANLALERLARRYDLPDLHTLAAYGRWRRDLPGVRRGLKRGFTFYGHEAGRPYRNGPGNDRRLLVAASPDDAVADSHWLREDVDAFLAARAAAEGIELWQETELTEVRTAPAGGAWRLSGRRRGRAVEIAAGFVVDASGPGGFLARTLPIPSALGAVRTDARLLGGHFTGVRTFPEVAREQGAELPEGPYLDDLAAVHHVLEDGWMYVLRFDHGTTSAGFMLRNAPPGPAPERAAGRGARARGASGAEVGKYLTAAEAWELLLARHPAIAAQFAAAVPTRPLVAAPRAQHRLAAAAGPGWVLLPHAFAFVDPLFSTGIAWGLLGVERLARAFEDAGGGPPGPVALDRYARLLAAEASRTDLLVHAAYRAMPDFDLFRWVALLYFAAVSFAEVRQRLLPEEETAQPAAWQGFLGVGDPVLDPVFEEVARRVGAPAARASAAPTAASERFGGWLLRALAPRNVAGVGDPARRHLYPVDLGLLRERAPLLGLTAEELEARLPRLRSGS